MIELNVEADIRQAVRHLDDLQRRKVPVAMQRALIGTAKVVRDAEIAEAQRVFHNPTRWTLGSIKVGPQQNFSIKVGVLDPDGFYRRANKYLHVQIQGGTRQHKAFESALTRAGVMPNGWYAVPGQGAKLDAYGNMGPGQIKQIMSWFNVASPFAGSTQNMTDATRARRRKGTKKNRGFEYFAAMPGERTGRRSWINGRRQNLQPGIYQRTYFGFGSAIKPVLIFVPRVSYRKRFDFFGLARRVVDKEYIPRFESALNR